MNYELINSVCYVTCIGSLVAGTVLGVSSIWLGDYLPMNFTAKGLTTTIVLFGASALGALVTKLLVL